MFFICLIKVYLRLFCLAKDDKDVFQFFLIMNFGSLENSSRALKILLLIRRHREQDEVVESLKEHVWRVALNASDIHDTSFVH